MSIEFEFVVKVRLHDSIGSMPMTEAINKYGFVEDYASHLSRQDGRNFWGGIDTVEVTSRRKGT